MSKLLILVVISMITISAVAKRPMIGQNTSLPDDSFPTVGKPMPDLLLKNIEGIGVGYKKISQFKGKWLVLDFWNKGCTACIASFPKVNKLYQELGDRVQIILVGLEDRQNEIRPMYERFKKSLKLELPCSFDSTIFKRLDIFSCPHVVIIDSTGIVRVVTSELNPESFKNLINGKESIFLRSYFRQHDTVARSGILDINISKPLFVNNNGGPDSAFIFRTLIAAWKPDMPYNTGSSIKSAIAKGLFQVTGVNMKRLYSYALFGKYLWSFSETEYGKIYPEPLFEAKDSSLFISDKPGANVFCYSMVFPPGSLDEETFKGLMKAELDAFCRVHSRVEYRKMPYWSLVTVNPNLVKELASKGDSTYYKEPIPKASIAAKNIPVKKLLERFYSNVQTSYPFIDESGINFNIDIKLDCILSDLGEVRAELQKNGLDLVIRTRDMKVAVIY